MPENTVHDDHYQTLCEIEKQMKNEITVLDFENSRFCRYLKNITGTKISPRAASKAISMLYVYYEKRGNGKACQICRSEIEHLQMAASKKHLQDQYGGLEFNGLPVIDRYSDDALAACQMRMLTIGWLISALIAALLLAIAALVLHWSFWFFWVFSLVLMVFADIWIYKKLVPNLVLKRLQQDLQQMEPEKSLLPLHLALVQSWKRQRLPLFTSKKKQIAK
jgi:hypothetical protein